MKPKEYLQQYRESMDRTKAITDHLDELKEEAIRLKDHEGHSVALDDAAARHVDACNTAAVELEQLEALRKEITETIKSVPDARLRELLYEIYIVGKKIVRIAADRDLSYEHVCRMHGQALIELSAVLPEK